MLPCAGAQVHCQHQDPGGAPIAGPAARGGVPGAPAQLGERGASAGAAGGVHVQLAAIQHMRIDIQPWHGTRRRIGGALSEGHAVGWRHATQGTQPEGLALKWVAWYLRM